MNKSCFQLTAVKPKNMINNPGHMMMAERESNQPIGS